MKRYKFDLGGSYVLYEGVNLGAAIAAFLKHRPERLEEIEAVTETPVKEYEKP